MQKLQIAKVLLVSLAAFVVFFLIACRFIYQYNEQYFFDRSVLMHTNVAKLVSASVADAVNDITSTDDQMGKKKQGLINFYLRDKLSLLHAYYSIAVKQADIRRAKTQARPDTLGDKVIADDSSSIADLDILFVALDEDVFITTSSSRFILDLTDEEGYTVRQLLKESKNDGSEVMINLKGSDNQFYALLSSGESQKILVAVNSTRKILNLRPDEGNDNFVLNYITHMLEQTVEDKGFSYSVFGTKRIFTPELPDEIKLSDQAVQRAASQGQYDYVYNHKLHTYVLTIHYLKSFDLFLLLSSNISSLNDIYFKTIRNIGLAMLAVYIVFAVVAYFVIRSLSVKIRDEVEELDETVRDFERYNFTEAAERKRAVEKLKEVSAKQQIPQVIHFAKSITGILDNMLGHYDDYVKDSLKEVLKRGEYSVSKYFQHDILPTADTIPSSSYLDISTFLDSAFDMGGNFYTIFKLDEDNIAFALGDVNSRAKQGAKNLINISPLIEKRLRQGLSPNKTLNVLNREINQKYGGKVVVSLIIGIINEKTGNFIIANADMCPPMLITKDGVADLEPHEVQRYLGSDPDYEYSQFKGILVQSDSLMLISKGVEKTTNPDGAVYSREQLKKVVQEAVEKQVDEMLLDLYNDISKFRVEKKPKEDVVVVCLKQKSIRF